MKEYIVELESLDGRTYVRKVFAENDLEAVKEGFKKCSEVNPAREFTLKQLTRIR